MHRKRGFILKDPWNFYETSISQRYMYNILQLILLDFSFAINLSVAFSL